MTALWCGTPVYIARNLFVTYALMVIGALCIAHGVKECGLPCALVCFAATYIIYDAYSGVLHVMLDDPKNLRLPILGQPCLEFQWHHHIPDDIVLKPFIECCADLNFAVGANFAVHFFTSAKLGANPVIILLLGCKMLSAYFGQFSHRCAHMGLSQRGALITGLQKTGIMTTFAQHRVHHTPPHDSNFCLLGPCNSMVQSLKNMIPNTEAWLLVFFTWTIFDISLIAAGIGCLFGA